MAKAASVARRMTGFMEGPLRVIGRGTIADSNTIRRCRPGFKRLAGVRVGLCYREVSLFPRFWSGGFAPLARRRMTMRVASKERCPGKTGKRAPRRASERMPEEPELT